MKKAIFLDRDGTLIEDNGHLGRLSQVVFFKNTFEALQSVTDEYLLFIVTNQQGIAEGIITNEEVYSINQYIAGTLSEKNIIITDIYVCPHKIENACECRKPKPYFLYKARRDYNINLTESYVIGDHPSDVQLALNSGARGIYVLTGHGKKHLPELEINTVVVSGIQEAVDYIMNNK